MPLSFILNLFVQFQNLWTECMAPYCLALHTHLTLSLLERNISAKIPYIFTSGNIFLILWLKDKEILNTPNLYGITGCLTLG